MPCLTVALLGTGSASHPFRNQSSVLVDGGEGPVLIDAGCGSWKTFLRLGYSLGDLAAVVVTHAHMDHVCSLSHIAFLAGFKAPGAKITVYTPGGLHRVIVESLLQAGSATSGSRFEVIETGPGDEFAVGNLVFRPLPAVHLEGSLSYEVKARDPAARLVVSGDTAPSEELERASRGAQLVVHEATMPWGRGEEAVRAGHSSVDQAIKVARGADELVLYHMSLESEESARKASMEPQPGGPRRIVVGSDGMVLRIC